MAFSQLESTIMDLDEAIQSLIELCSGPDLDDVYVVSMSTLSEIAIGFFLLGFLACILTRIFIDLLNSAWKLLTALFCKLTTLFCKFTLPPANNIGHAKEASTPSKKWNDLVEWFVRITKQFGLSMSKDTQKRQGNVVWNVRHPLIQDEFEDALQRALNELLEDAANEYDLDTE